MRLQAEHAVDDLRARAARAVSAQLMFASSSKRAISSTTTVTSLPRRAASISASISTEFDAGAVDGLLDRDDVGIVGGAADELDDRVERLVRVVQQDVVLADRREDVVAFGEPRREAPGTNGGYSSASIVDLVDQRREPHHVDRAVAAVQVVVGRARTASSRKLRERARDSRRRPRAAAAAPNWRCGSSPCSAWRRFLTSSSSIHRSASRVTRNCEYADDLAPGEQIGQVRVDHGRQQQERRRRRRRRSPAA